MKPRPEYLAGLKERKLTGEDICKLVATLFIGQKGG